jgi:hypothetical protein
MATQLTLQSLSMRGRGLGWKADRCVDPETCDLHLCVVDHQGGYWHPADPLAFAKWRVRADVDAIPGPSWDSLRRSAMVGAVGLGTAAVLGMLWGGQRIFSMKTLSGSEAYAPKASRST